MLAIMFPWVIMVPFGVPEENEDTAYAKKDKGDSNSLNKENA